MKQRWCVLAAGFFANAIFAMAITGISAVAILLQKTYVLSNQKLGIVLGMIALGIAVSEFFWGILTDRLGDRRVLQIGLSGLIFLFGYMVFNTNTHSLIPLLFLVGFVGGSINGASGRAIMMWFEPQEQGFAMSIRQTALPVGGALGALLLPTLATFFNFNTVYVALFVLNTIALILVLLWIHEPEIGHQNTQIQTHNGLKTLNFWKVILFSACLCFPQIATSMFAAIFLHQVCHFSLLQTSVCVMAIQLCAGALRILIGRWTDIYQIRGHFLKLFPTILAVCFIVLWWSMKSYRPLLTAIIFIMTTILSACWNGIAYAQMATLAGKHYIGRALGIGNTFVFGMFFLTTACIPMLVKLRGWQGVWLVTCLFILIAFILVPSPYAKVVKILKTK